MTLVLDAGALIAIERDDFAVIAALQAALERDEEVRVPVGALAQVWRGGRDRQARLALLLAAFDVVGIDPADGRSLGVLLGRARASDVIDASVAACAEHGDTVLTSDPEDIADLARARRIRVSIVRV